MIRLTHLALAVLCAATLPVFADGHFQGLAEDALGNAQRFTDFSLQGAEDTLAIDVETDLPQSDMTTGDLQDAGLIASGSASTEGTAFGTISNNIGDWGVSANDQSLLSVADAAVSTPDALVDPGTFSTSGGVCTVDSFEDAPLLERLCQRVRSEVSASCTATADITVFVTQNHRCEDRGVFGGAECHEEIDRVNYCTQTANYCASGGGITGCFVRVREYSCSSDEPMTVTGRPVGDPIYGEPIITWDETCTVDYAADRCVETGSSCTNGPTVEDVNGLLVPMDCIEETTEYTCAGLDYSSDCDVFENDAACSLQSSTCFTIDPDGRCGGYEQVYQCGGTGGQDFDSSCDAVNVCVGGVCQSIPQESNDDIAVALVGIDALNTMAEELGHDATVDDILNGTLNGDFNVDYFSATRRSCRIGILGTINCCADSGWALGSIAECNSDEVAIYGARQAGAAVYIETYCSERFLIVCAQRSRRYCTYNSRIARIISEQGLRQLYGRFECRAMTQAEIEAIDWDQIDFSSAFGDMFENVGSIAPTDLSTLIQDNILLSQPEVVDVYE